MTADHDWHLNQK